jgi:hypothetical protein
VKSKLRVRGFDQFPFTTLERREPRIDVNAGHQVTCQLQVVLEVARLGAQQAAIELRQFVIQARQQRGKALAGARLDQRPRE